MTAAANSFFFPWEISLIEALQAHLPAALIPVVSTFSMFGEELFMILIIGFLYWGLDKECGRAIGLNVLLGNVWNPMIKNVALRRRPYFESEDIQLLRVVKPGADIYDLSAQGYSFPSGHSTCSAGLFGSLAVWFRRRWLTLLCVFVPLLVGFSRVAMGAHFPTDVLFGWLCGLAAIAFISALQKRVRSRAVFYGILLLTTLPGFLFCHSEDYFTCMGLMIGFMAAIPVEEKFVRFENTRSIPRTLLRVLGGVAIFFALNKLLKLPFSSAFLDGGTLPALLVRCARYALISFIEFAVYPMAFRLTAKR
ncbi:MAG: phosphatase PAP2 family protein [Clostridia bacterium]|nr:phosphatase PAP2 family protein [Clostridia bacterium]